MLTRTYMITAALGVLIVMTVQPATARGGGGHGPSNSANRPTSFTVTHGGNPPRASAPPAAGPTVRDHRRSNVEVRDHRQNRQTVIIRDHR